MHSENEKQETKYKRNYMKRRYLQNGREFMFKKVLAVTLAFGMIFSMGGSVMAAETEETVDTAEAA